MFEGLGRFHNCLKFYISIWFNNFILKVKNVLYFYSPVWTLYIYPAFTSHRTSYLCHSDQISDLYCSTWLMEKPLIEDINWNSDLSFIFERCWQSAAPCIWRSAIRSHGRSKSWVLLLDPSFYHKEWTGKFFH